MKFLVKFDLEFDLKFEISDGKNLVKFWGRTFRPARKARNISGRISGQISEQISEKISETSFQISRLFSETSFSRRAVLKVWETQLFADFRRFSQTTADFPRKLLIVAETSFSHLLSAFWCSPKLAPHGYTTKFLRN